MKKAAGSLQQEIHSTTEFKDGCIFVSECIVEVKYVHVHGVFVKAVLHCVINFVLY